MAAFNARQHNPKLKEYDNQLIARGKPYKVAMVAVMRKLLVIMNTMIKTNVAQENMSNVSGKALAAGCLQSTLNLLKRKLI